MTDEGGLYVIVRTQDDRGCSMTPTMWLRRPHKGRDLDYAGPYVLAPEPNRPVEVAAEDLLARWGFALVGAWRVASDGSRAWIWPVSSDLPAVFTPPSSTRAVLDLIDDWTVQTVKGLRAVRAIRAAVRAERAS